MALINCPECGGKISDTVKSCIHCGYNLNPPAQNKTQDSFSKDYEEWKKKESQTNDSSNGKQSAPVEMTTKELIWLCYTDNKRFQKLPKEIKRPVQIKVIIFCIIFGVVGFGSIPYIAQPGAGIDACDCVNVLNVPTQKVGIGMPMPIGHMSDADFAKYESCYEHYTSHWGAMKKCGDF